MNVLRLAALIFFFFENIACLVADFWFPGARLFIGASPWMFVILAPVVVPLAIIIS